MTVMTSKVLIHVLAEPVTAFTLLPGLFVALVGWSALVGAACEAGLAARYAEAEEEWPRPLPESDGFKASPYEETGGIGYPSRQPRSRTSDCRTYLLPLDRITANDAATSFLLTPDPRVPQPTDQLRDLLCEGHG